MQFSKHVFFIILTMGIIFSGFSQQEYRIEGKPNLKVSGTSTLHDWDMISEEASGNAKLTLTHIAAIRSEVIVFQVFLFF